MNKKAAGQMDFIISLIVIGLFTIAIILFVTNFANDNSSAINVADDSQISNLLTGTTANVSSFQSDVGETTSSILGSTIAPGSTTTTSGTQYSITATSAIGTVRNILIVGYQKIFGTGSGFSIFLYTFLGIIAFISILYLIKLWRAGLPD